LHDVVRVAPDHDGSVLDQVLSNEAYSDNDTTEVAQVEDVM